MYKHLLIPVDGSPISDLNVERAVELAAALGSQITFLYIASDFGATERGALLRTIDPEGFATALKGDGDAYLARAAAVAKACGLVHATISLVSDHAERVIVEVVRERQCDLVVMSSRDTHSLGAWFRGNEAEQVLRRCSVAVLMTRAEGVTPLSAQERALGIIRSEHRSLMVVAYALGELVEGNRRADDATVDSLAGMVAFLRGFPRREHHPKEELYLHRLIRLRAGGDATILEVLEEQHRREYALLDVVGGLLAEVREGKSGAHLELTEKIQALVYGIASHIAQEERDVFPLATRLLNEEDWEEVAGAFSSNTMSAFLAAEVVDFPGMFRGIAHMTLAGL